MAPVGRRPQALLVVPHLRKGDTYAELAVGFGIGIGIGTGIGTTTVYRYLRASLDLPAAMTPTLTMAIEVTPGRAYVILERTLLRIDRVRMAGARDRPHYCGQHKSIG